MPKAIPGQKIFGQMYIPNELAEQLRELAYRLNRKQTDIVREGIMMMIAKYQKESKTDAMAEEARKEYAEGKTRKFPATT